MSTDLHHLAAAYALDALDDDERQAFEAHFPTCEICSNDVRLDREVAAGLADRAGVAPPEHLKASIMAQISQTRQISPSTTPEVTGRRRGAAKPAVNRWLAVAAASLLLVVGTVLVTASGGSGSELDDVVAAPDAAVTALDGTRGSMRVVWSPSRQQVAVFANGVDVPEAGFVYELWSLGADGGAAPAGLFSPSSDGVVRTVLDVDADDPSGWGVTVEPDGGSEQPTSDVVFSGPL